MIRRELLDEGIVWDEAGHLSDVAQSALADGQDAILPPAALTHFSHCPACLQRVGEAALLSAQFSSALGGARAHEHSLPWIPICVATLIGAVAAVPMLPSARFWLSALSMFFGRGLRIAGHGLYTLATNGLAPTFYLGCTVVLLAMGFAVTRLMPGPLVLHAAGRGRERPTVQ